MYYIYSLPLFGFLSTLGLLSSKFILDFKKQKLKRETHIKVNLLAVVELMISERTATKWTLRLDCLVNVRIVKPIKVGI